MARVVVIAGPPGSGKTTVAELLAREVGLPLVSAGGLFRRMAAERGLTLEAFGRRAAEDHVIDRELDRQVLEEVTARTEAGEGVVVEGRLPAHLLTRRGVEAFRVWLDAPLRVRAERVGKRDGRDPATARRAVRAREALEAQRYAAIYGIDVRDRSVYDLTLDTSDRGPEALVARIRREAGL